MNLTAPWVGISFEVRLNPNHHAARPMDPKVGDYVRFKHKRVEITGTVIKRSGTRIRVQPKDGGATLWKELRKLPPLASPVSEALGPVRPIACDDGDDTNLDDIDDIDDAVAVAAQSAQAAEAEAETEAEAAGKRLAGIVRVRGGGCAASKPRAQAEPFNQDLDGPPRSPSLAVEQGAEATPEDTKVVEPVPETTDSAPTEVVEPAAGEATEAETATEVTRAEPPPAEASAETRNPIFEIGSSWIDAIVQAFTPRGTSVPNTAPTSIELAPLWTTEDLKEVSTRLADQLFINTENQVQIEEIFNHLHQTKDGILTKEEFGPRTPREVSLRDGSVSLPFWAPPLAAHHTSPAPRGPVQPPPSSPQLACALPRALPRHLTKPL